MIQFICRCAALNVSPLIVLGVLLAMPFLGWSAAPNALHAAPSSASTGKRIEVRLAPIVRQTMQELSIPGAIVGVWMKDEEPWTVALGTADRATGAALTLAHHMRIGSITKTFTGTVILQLQDEGKLSLHDRVAKYLPASPDGEQITIRQLGDMTSGLFNYSEDRDMLATLDAQPSKNWTPPELITVAFKHKPYFAPGQGWHYSNTNTVLLGMIIEKVTGHQVQEEFQRRILRPLGMVQTSFATDGGLPTPYAHGYMYGTNANPSVPSGTSPRDVTNDNPSWSWTAGAMISTLADLQRYAKPLATGQLVSRKAQEERLQWVDTTSGPSGLKYGFAIGNFGGAIGHNGQIPGFQCFMGYIPDRDITVIVLTNLYATPDEKGPADELTRRIILALQEL